MWLLFKTELQFTIPAALILSPTLSRNTFDYMRWPSHSHVAVRLVAMTWARDKLNGFIKGSVSANTHTPLGGLERVSGWEEFKIELIKINVHC